jgi:cytochrome c
MLAQRIRRAAERNSSRPTGAKRSHHPGIPGANGVVGPPLLSVAQSTYIAGNFPNTPENLTEWVIAPQKMKPNTDTPSLSEPQARNVIGYLETLQ